MSYRKSREIAPAVKSHEARRGAELPADSPGMAQSTASARPESTGGGNNVRPESQSVDEPFHIGALSEPLHGACWNGDTERLHELLNNREAKHLSLINETDGGGANLLHLVAFWGNLEVAETLVEYNIDVNALNIMQQRPLDVAMQWGNIDVADLIRNNGGRSMFETRIEMLEGVIKNLEADLAESRELHRLETELREKTEKERDFWIESAHFVQDKWNRANTEKIVSQATSTAVQSQLFRTAKRRDELNSLWADATGWATGADYVAKKLWGRMKCAEESRRATREKLYMALEEKRAALMDREAALMVRDASLRAVEAAEKSRELAERVSAESQALARHMVPYKKKSFQLMRQIGMANMQNKFKSVFEICPPKILDGAIKTLSYLCENENSPALPKIDVPVYKTPRPSPVREKPSSAGQGQMILPSELEAISRNTPGKRVDTAPSRVGEIIPSHSDKMASRQRHVRSRANRPTTATADEHLSKRGHGIFRRMFDSARMPRTQVEEDFRRAKGEVHRMGLPPEVPFDLLVLDPYGQGLEVLTCTHVRNDSKGFQRLRVTHKAELKQPYKKYDDQDFVRKMEWFSLQAEMRNKEAQKRNRKRDRSSKPLDHADCHAQNKLGWGDGVEVPKLDDWVHADETREKKRKQKLYRKRVERKRLKDKYNSSEDESEVKERALTWKNAVLR